MRVGIFLSNSLGALILLAATTTILAQEIDVEEIKGMLEDQNNLLRQQQKDLEAFREQNKRLRDIISKYQAAHVAFGEIESITPNQKPLSDDAATPELDSISSDQFKLAPEWNFSFAPRTALRSITTSYDFDDPRIAPNLEDLAFWTNGATIGVNSPWLPNTSFLFTGLYGKSKTKGRFIGILDFQGSSLAFPALSKNDATLLDFELIARTLIPGTTANWLIAMEYVNLDNQFSVISGAPVFNGANQGSARIDLYVLKAGIGGFFNLSDDGKHRIFANILGAGHYTNARVFGNGEAWFGYGGDVNIGYEWIIDKNFSISPRYRGQFLYFETKDETLADQFNVIHGPELHFISRF